MSIPTQVRRTLASSSLALAVLTAVAPGRGQSMPPSRIWSIVSAGSGGLIEQSGREHHLGPGPRTWRITLHAARVGWYRVRAYAQSAAPVTAQLTAASRPQQGPQRLDTGASYATEWLVCTSPVNSPIVLEVQAGGAADWAFAFWEPPTSVPMPGCP